MVPQRNPAVQRRRAGEDAESRSCSLFLSKPYEPRTDQFQTITIWTLFWELTCDECAGLILHREGMLCAQAFGGRRRGKRDENMTAVALPLYRYLS